MYCVPHLNLKRSKCCPTSKIKMLEKFGLFTKNVQNLKFKEIQQTVGIVFQVKLSCLCKTGFELSDFFDAGNSSFGLTADFSGCFDSFRIFHVLFFQTRLLLYMSKLKPNIFRQLFDKSFDKIKFLVHYMQQLRTQKQVFE